MVKFDQMDPDDFAYSGPMVLSNKAKEEIYKTLIEALAKITKLAVDSKPETNMHLNMDWMRF